MGSASDLTEVEKQLLMAAVVHDLRPATDLSQANSVRIVNQVLQWCGLSAEQIDSGWRVSDCDPEHETVYAALVRMTHQKCRDGNLRPAERPGPALFEGGGNWGVTGDTNRPACWPHYNSCRLTIEGERLALLLLEQHREFR